MTELELAKLIDHTLLQPQATEAEIMQLCNEACAYSFASVCVNPCWVEAAVKAVGDSSVRVCTVVGFPLGANLSNVKIKEAEEALNLGAKEIDVVINVGRVKMGDEEYLLQELKALSLLCRYHQGTLKVILETALLTDDEKRFAARIAKAAGADFVKTSTGFAEGGATPEDVAILRSTVGEELGIKASGGIRSYSDVNKMLASGATRIGTSSGIKIIKEFTEEGGLVDKS